MKLYCWSRTTVNWENYYDYIHKKCSKPFLPVLHRERTEGDISQLTHFLTADDVAYKSLYLPGFFVPSIGPPPPDFLFPHYNFEANGRYSIELDTDVNIENLQKN
jgi:hypothetical protein